MDSVLAIIERGKDGGYSIYSKDVKGGYGYGLTEQEAKDDFKEVLDEQAEDYHAAHGVFPAWYSKPVEYRYDFSAFFEAFPFINVSQFAQNVGINPSLMRKYKSRLAFASESQKKSIQSEFDEIVHRLSLVRF